MSPAIAPNANGSSATSRPGSQKPPNDEKTWAATKETGQARGTDFKVTREIDGGLQTVKLKGPAIVTTDLRLSEPQYASLPNIMKAKKKPIAEKTVADYGVDVVARLEVLRTSEPPGRKAGVKVKDVAELVSKLKNEAGVL
jgi:electron transfer flavoprotein beta subunit